MHDDVLEITVSWLGFNLTLTPTISSSIVAIDIYRWLQHNYYLYPTEAILQKHLQCNISDIRQVLSNSYLLGSYSPVQCLIWQLLLGNNYLLGQLASFKAQV